MSNPSSLQGEPPPQTPLLDSDQNQHQERERELELERRGDDDLEEALIRLELFLSILGFNQSSVLSYVLSWISFIAIGLVIPIAVLVVSDCDGCQKYQYRKFEVNIVTVQALLAAISVICVSHNLKKHGIRKLLFVDRYNGQMVQLHHLYVQQISNSVRLLVWWLLPCFILKIARELLRIYYVRHEAWWLSIVASLALILSWTYVSAISLAASTMFHLVCNLQVIHFDDYSKLLEKESDVSLFIHEHGRLRQNLSKISHRFRVFLILQFLVVTVSQFVTLFHATGYGGVITFINGGDFAVYSIVQVAGIILCLHAATKISHRAQAVVSLVSKWHALATCGSADSAHVRVSSSVGNLEAIGSANTSSINLVESDIESVDYVAMPTNSQMSSYWSFYHERQAFVTYLQTNPGGITIFGWTVDRGLINTIFFLELSLVTFVLGKTIVYSAD